MSPKWYRRPACLLGKQAGRLFHTRNPTGFCGNRRQLRLGVLPILIAIQPVRAAEWYAATNGDGSAGTNWATAFTNVHQALAAAAASDSICLAGHRFACTSALQWTVSSLALTGGYAAAGGTPGPLGTTPTILTRTGGIMRILSITGVTNATLARVTLTGGNTTQMGGGLCISNAANLTLDTCVVSNNSSYLSGGGVYLVSSTNVLVAGCLFHSNRQADATADWVSRYGGGLYAANSYGTITNTLFIDNVATTVGGAHNTMRGGAISLTGGRWSLHNCLFLCNRVSYYAGDGGGSNYAQGGALHVGGGSHCARNCLLVGNDCQNPWSGSIYGDGICLESGALTLLHSTLFGNVGEGIRNSGGTLAVTNCILWRHLAGDIVGTVQMAFCLTETGPTNLTNGCFSADPVFQQGFYLATNSPCVDAGTGSVTDAALDGYTTRADGTADTARVDIGYHYPTGLSAYVPALYVAPGGDNLNDGLSPGTALRTLTYAASLVTPGTVIHVAAGAYTNGLESFPISLARPGVQLLGTDRDATVLDATGSGRPALILAGNFVGARVANLTLKGGSTPNQGGGLQAVNAADLVLESCAVISNMANQAAGGASIVSSPNVRISNCLFRANRVYNTLDWTTGSGGALLTVFSSGLVVDSLFTSNNISHSGGHCASRGGAIDLEAGRWTLDRCVISSNRAAAYAGFGNGWMVSRGAGLYVGSGTHEIRNSLIHSNDCTTGYDGLFGDGVCVNAGTVVLNNNTLVYNAGEGLRRSGGTVAATNTLFWGNGDDITGSVVLAYCDIQNGDSNGVSGCISTNPLFVSPTAADFRLSIASPCLNAGTNLPWMAQARDLDGNPRVLRRIVDLGAFENPTPAAVLLHLQ